MRMVKWSACISGLCGFVVALCLGATSASADVTTERGASILAFPKVLADGTSDTIVQITNISNSMVHAHCFYVNAQLENPALPEGPDNRPLWQETDFMIWLTKQQPTHWQVSTGRFVDSQDACFEGNVVVPEECGTAGLDPGAVPQVPDDFVGELKCIEVDAVGNPIGGNHLKGEATIKTGGDVAKYNAIGIQGTERAGETGNLLRLDQPAGSEEPEGQYNSCPNALIVNHFAEGVTDPVVLGSGRGGTCAGDEEDVCQTADDCDERNACDDGTCSLTGEDCGEDVDCVTCEQGPLVSPGEGALQPGDIALRSATLTDLTLTPCSQNFEDQIPGRVTVAFRIFNEFEQEFSASTTVTCWKNFFLHQVDSPNAPERSVFSYSVLGTTVVQTRLQPVNQQGGVIGIGGATRADRDSNLARAAFNLHIEGDRFTTAGVVDEIILPQN